MEILTPAKSLSVGFVHVKTAFPLAAVTVKFVIFAGAAVSVGGGISCLHPKNPPNKVANINIVTIQDFFIKSSKLKIYYILSPPPSFVKFLIRYLL